MWTGSSPATQVEARLLQEPAETSALASSRWMASATQLWSRRMCLGRDCHEVMFSVTSCYQMGMLAPLQPGPAAPARDQSRCVKSKQGSWSVWPAGEEPSGSFITLIRGHTPWSLFSCVL